MIFGALSSSSTFELLIYGVGANPETWGAVFTRCESQDPLGFNTFHLLESNPDNLLLRAGVVLIIAGIAFKIGCSFRFGA